MRRRCSTSVVALVAGAGAFLVANAFTSPVRGARNDWAEGTPGKSEGATRDYYNRAGLLRWKNYMGDWRDAQDKPQGDTPFASATVTDDDEGKYVEWDVSNLVR